VEGWVKLNTDVAFLLSTEESSAGIVAWNVEGGGPTISMENLVAL
jgi:hypothetical protein